MNTAEKYWFSFCFQYGSFQQSIFIGFPNNWVNKNRMQLAKKESGMPSDSVMISCSYLGLMTDELFLDEAKS